MKKLTVVNLVVFILGLGLSSAGIALLYPPAALMWAGVVLMAITTFGGKR